MYPYIRIGPIVLWTYGLTIGFAFVCAWKVLEVNLRRHGLPSRLAQPIILLLVISGIAGAKLYAVLETPAQLLAHPLTSLFSLNGYTWFGGFLAGVTTLWFLARHFNIPSLVLLDIASPCAALGYGVARLGCLLAGDGDYGTATSLPWGMSFPNGLVPTAEYVHPTPIYECLAGLLIFYYLWRVGKKDLPHGSISARYLVLTGIARFLVEYVRLNPTTMLGLSNAQLMSLFCVAVGLMLFGHDSLTVRWRTLDILGLVRSDVDEVAAVITIKSGHWASMIRRMLRSRTGRAKGRKVCQVGVIDSLRQDFRKTLETNCRLGSSRMSNAFVARGAFPRAAAIKTPASR